MTRGRSRIPFVAARGALCVLREALVRVGHGGFTNGHVGFSLPGGGGVNRAPHNWGWGVREKGSIDRYH